LDSYLSNRKQCVKIGSVCSSFSEIYKGLPQGSILVLFFFLNFITDIFCFISKSSLYNYADDNTLSYSDRDINRLTNVLEEESKVLITWFNDNQMQANPDKFQTIAVGKKTHDDNISFNLDGNIIKWNDEVKLLGVTFDFMLNFYSHISNICKRASQQLNVLKRIGLHLNRLSN
jgi:hypothetical protein